MADIGFGVFAPQGWKTELRSIEGAEAQWGKCREIAVLAEELGFDSVWVYDHFHNIPEPSHEAVFECWTTMAALAEATSRIRLGQMVSCTSYRSPALTAKITSSIDVISGGRLDWGVGAGWYWHEYEAYGWPFEENKVRIGKLQDAVEVVKAMWTQPDAEFEGKYFSVKGAQCDPKPVQQPHPPVWIGGGGEQLTLRVVARHADCANFGGKPHEWAHKREVLQRHCKDVGRDEDEIRKTISGEVLLREKEADIKTLVDSGKAGSLWNEPYDSWVAGNLVGTPEQVCEKIRAYVDLGCTYFVPWCSDYPDDTTLRLFAEQVLPEFR
ncbi:MAG TPA: LLM class F420-dependent oxidoreductase [Acidimicrobiia bacterium]|nr:LLM class F420-dependent oxidoreductase [Acidimicrobiia bacterium]